ncbi:MAG: universal stress protein [Thermoplasmatota archaeon]
MTPARPRIVVGHDESPQGDIAFAAAVRLAKDLDADLALVHAFSPPPPFEGLASSPTASDDSRVARIQQQEELVVLTKAADMARAEGIDVETIVEDAPAARLLLDTARRLDAPVIVVGTHGHKGFKRMILGSTAEEVVRRSDRPVLVVPRPDPGRKA